MLYNPYLSARIFLVHTVEFITIVIVYFAIKVEVCKHRVLTVHLRMVPIGY
jgi:hypothetical protein